MSPALVLVAALFAAPPPGAAKPSSLEPGRLDRAMALFEQSETALARGDLENARELLEQAYALDDDATLLFNLARLEDLAGRAGRALDHYRTYQQRHPEGPYAGLVSKRVSLIEADLELRLERATDPTSYSGSPPAAPSLTAEVPPKASPSLLGPVATLSTGAAGLVAGVVLGVMAQSSFNDAQGATSQAAAVDSFQQSRDLGTGANIALAAGAGITALGGLWLLLELD